MLCQSFCCTFWGYEDVETTLLVGEGRSLKKPMMISLWQRYVFSVVRTLWNGEFVRQWEKWWQDGQRGWHLRTFLRLDDIARIPGNYHGKEINVACLILSSIKELAVHPRQKYGLEGQVEVMFHSPEWHAELHTHVEVSFSTLTQFTKYLWLLRSPREHH